MTGLMSIVAWSTLAWLAAVTGIVFYGLLTGRIRTDGLLRDTAQSSLAPDRIQLLMMSLSGALAYLAYALHTIGADSLPPVPPTFVGLMGGSQLVYLAPKIIRRLRR